MPKKPSGGRGKREAYSTSVVRVPDPIKTQVLELIETFHQDRLNDSSPVTSIEQIPISLVESLLAAAAPVGRASDPPWNMCRYPRKRGEWCWNDQWDAEWERLERPQIQQFNQLADRVNCCIWQIDNTFALASPRDGDKALELLIEYRLLQTGDSKPATPRQLIDWTLEPVLYLNDVSEMARLAIQQKRWDILSALEILGHQPVNRQEYWHRKYKEQLAKTNVNYWLWRDNPESREICPELTNLLLLPEPKLATCRVLECLADNINPLLKSKMKQIGNAIDFGMSGRLGNCKPQEKQAYRQAFTQWHLFALEQLGEDILKRIYKVVYGCDWKLVQDIIGPIAREWWVVLGVSPNASMKEAKAAKRQLSALWHPDINKSPIAHQRIIEINLAFEQFEKFVTSKAK